VILREGNLKLTASVRHIRLRACIRIGEISRDLETPQGKHSADDRTKSKEQTLSDAGIANRTAYDYEELAGGREEQAQEVATAAADAYFATDQPLSTVETLTRFRLRLSSPMSAVRPRGNVPKSPLRWTIERASIEFKLAANTLRKVLNQGGAEPDQTGCYSTQLYWERKEAVWKRRICAPKTSGIEQQTSNKKSVLLQLAIYQ
jgi:hypothetical protein